MKPVTNNVMLASSLNILDFQALHVALDDKPFLCQIHKDLEKDPFVISIKS
jgi:hypothetical protein